MEGAPTYRSSTLLEAYKRMWRKFGDFDGRATRSEYWLATATHFVFTAALNFCVSALFGSLPSEGGVWLGLLKALTMTGFVLFCFPLVPLTIRRLHDSGRSGWWFLLALTPLPILPGCLILIFACLDSQRGSNRFGPSEKYPD